MNRWSHGFAALLVLSLVLAIAGPPASFAQTTSSSAKSLDAAKKHMERGQELFLLRQYEEAAAEFGLAYQAQPFAAFLYNQAVCFEKAGRTARALELFQRCLTADPNAPDAEKIRARIRRLQEVLAPTPSASASIDAGVDASADAMAPDAAVLPPRETQDQMRSLVIVESDPTDAPVTVYLRESDNAPPFTSDKPPQGWTRVQQGRTPLNLSLGVGKYHIVMEPFADFQRSETDIEVAAGHVHQFKANLRQGEFLGSLRVTTPAPGARVYLDDPPPHKKPPWGVTPYDGMIGTGDHQIWVERAGYKTSTRRFSISHGERREELVELERVARGMLSIEGNAADISVEIDGVVRGIASRGAPLEIELEPGPHRVRAKAEGRKKLVQVFQVPRGQVLPVVLVLAPSYPRGVAWSQAVASAVFFGGGIALGVHANNIYNDLDSERKKGVLTSDDDRYTTGKIFAISSNVCLGLGVLAAGASTYNFLRDPYPESSFRLGAVREYSEGPVHRPPAAPAQHSRLPEDEAPLVVPRFGFTGTSLQLEGRF